MFPSQRFRAVWATLRPPPPRIFTRGSSAQQTRQRRTQWKLFLTTSAKRAGHKKSGQRSLYNTSVRFIAPLFCALFVRYSSEMKQNQRKPFRNNIAMIQYKLRRFATIQSDFGHIWEQEAASSSLATPTTRKAARKRLRTFPGGFLFVLKDGVTWADGRCKPGCRRRRTGSGR